MADALRIRVHLDDADPPVWRVLDVAPGTTLDRLHAVLQAAMGWSDSHLHEFSVGDAWEPGRRRFLTDDDVAEGETGTEESDVAVEQVLRSPGDELRYLYDFGDSWRHTLVLEGRVDGTGAVARLVGGSGACPPENAGGIGTYAEDLERRGPRARALAERFDVGEAERAVRWAAGDRADDDVPALVPGGAVGGPPGAAELPEAVDELLGRAVGPGEGALVELVERAGLGRAVLVDAATAARMVAPVASVVQHIGARGRPLTSAGYLRPADVVALAAALQIGDEWIGTLNREVHTLPLLLFREALQRAGLLRISRGLVLASRRAVNLLDDPVGLWWHVAERLPVGRGAERDAGMLVLLDVAGTGSPAAALGRSGEDPWPGDRLGAAMRTLGWERRGGEPLSGAEVHRLAERTTAVLHRCGAFVDAGWGRSSVPTPEGVALARAALRTWR